MNLLHMSVLKSLVHKETLQLIRDKRTMLIVMLMPVVLLLLFGFAISMEVNNVKVVVVTDNHTPRTRIICERLRANSYFDFKGEISQSEIEPLLRRGAIDAALVMRSDNGNFSAQIIDDASNPAIAQTATAYIRSVVTDNDSANAAIIRTLYNPQLKSAYNFVPGIMGMIFILVCAIMTSVSIVGEKESGTMDLLQVSPLRPAYVVIGKLIPYFILSCMILALMLSMAYGVLGLPFPGGMVWVIALSLLYILLSLSIGLLVSTLVSTRVSALIVSAIMFMVPVIMLSGMIFPIDNMPRILQWISCIVPARWYTEAMRKLMVQELTPGYITSELLILTAMTTAILSLAIIKFRKQK